jgi:hypothetical protein
MNSQGRFLQPGFIIVAVLLAGAAIFDVGLLVNIGIQAYDSSNDPATAQFTGFGIVLYAVLLLIPAFLVTAALAVLLAYLRRRLRMPR